MPRYKHADILRAVADASESSETPWDVVEFTDRNGKFVKCADFGDFCFAVAERAELRIRPKTRVINGVECPEALRVAPEVGAHLWVESATSGELSYVFRWTGSPHQLK